MQIIVFNKDYADPETVRRLVRAIINVMVSSKIPVPYDTIICVVNAKNFDSIKRRLKAIVACEEYLITLLPELTLYVKTDVPPNIFIFNLMEALYILSYIRLGRRVSKREAEEWVRENIFKVFKYLR